MTMPGVKTRSVSFLAISAMYALALVCAVLVFQYLKPLPVLMATFIADAAGTVVIWLFGIALKNSSVYDPYWSVAPVAIVLGWASAQGVLRLSDILFLVLLGVWGCRLTANWGLRWRGLGHEDWRYGMYRGQMPRLWFIVNLFGINLMPTVLVYLAMIPVYIGMNAAGSVNLLTAAGFAVSAAAILLELLADRRMDAYLLQPPPKSSYNTQGLWHWCRHPNYLGEILFWWGLWLMQASLAPASWSMTGAALITLLFVFVSIPMMEKHVLEKRPEYARYIKDVPMLLPLPRKTATAGEIPPPDFQ
jgi:steroid 5-alpha reductase family enzyme